MLKPILSLDALFERLSGIKLSGATCYFSREKCEELFPIIQEIDQLKRDKRAVIFAHSYVGPEIQATVADFVGDSYGLSQDAMNTDADVIVFVAVRFMAETAKILNPGKQVMIPSTFNGCSLADAITGDDIKRLRQQYPDYTFVCYINTTAEVKAACDVCVTSSNVYHIIEKIPNDHIYFLPDRLMGENVILEMKRRGVKKDILCWNGTCYVHEDYQPEMIDFIRLQYPGVRVISHPECMPGVISQSDFSGSTEQIIRYIRDSGVNDFFVLTECGLMDRLRLEMPGKQFIGTCSLCKYMKSNHLASILQVLKAPEPDQVIEVSPEVRTGALRSIQAMFNLVSAR